MNIHFDNEAMKIAQTENGYAIHIDEVEKGYKKCTCIKCGEKLKVKKGKIQTWHFSHLANSECKGAQETALHKLAKQIIGKKTEIKINEIESLLYSRGELEIPIAKELISLPEDRPIIPDVTAISNEENIYFEVAVTNPKGIDHKMFYRRNKLKCLEIHLEKLPLNSTYDKIEEAILRTPENIEIIYPYTEPIEGKEKTYAIREPENNNSYTFIDMLLNMVLIGFLIWFAGTIISVMFPSKKRHNRQ
jgi:hypothetical protein